jgi:hypothetical protein
MNNDIKSHITLDPISQVQDRIIIKLNPLTFLGCYKTTSDVAYAIILLEKRLTELGWNAKLNSETRQEIVGESFASEKRYVTQFVRDEIENVKIIVNFEIKKRLINMMY